MHRSPDAVPVCTARAGRALRFVIGSETLPELDFAAPDAPAWTTDRSVQLALSDEGFTLADDGTRVLSGTARHTPLRLEFDVGDAQVFGFGAATGGADRNRSRFRIMTLDTLFYAIPGASYTALPFFMAYRRSGPIGVMIASTYPLDVGVSDGHVSVSAAASTDGTPVDVIVFRGTVVEILRDLSDVVGRSFLPPAWALGFHQSRWSYRTQREVLEIARRFRTHDLPADVVHLDIHYMDRYRVFTFDPQRFPRPREMHDALSAMGFRTLAIIDPGVSAVPYPVHDSLKSGDMLLTRADGSPYVGKVWPGATVFPDFSQARTREAWSRFHEPLLGAGISGFWIDMNDPVLKVGKQYDPLTEDVQHHGAPHRRQRNLYANGMAEATARGIARVHPDRRPFVLSRSGFLGIQRHAAVWTGDNHSTWEHLRENLDMVLNLGLSGVPLTGADVGGFGRCAGILGSIKLRRPPAELYVRWMELGALMPFFRAHCTLYAPRQEPWSFGRRALDLVRRVLRRRYRLLPLLYRLALEAHETGLPIVRPLFMHFDVPEGRGADQFLLGDSVLAAPVMHEGVTRREVWLPPGSWIDWNTHCAHGGAQIVTVDAPLGTTPLFVRVGAGLFLAEPGRNADEALKATLSLEVSSPAPGTAGRGSLFLDDGETTGYRRFVLDVVSESLEGRLRVGLRRVVDNWTPTQRDIEVRVPPGYVVATVDGRRCDLEMRDLSGEDRSGTLLAVRVPLDAQEILFE
jgi:alpha-glucosidase